MSVGFHFAHHLTEAANNVEHCEYCPREEVFIISDFSRLVEDGEEPKYGWEENVLGKFHIRIVCKERAKQIAFNNRRIAGID